MTDQELAEHKAERMMEFRHKIFEAIPEDCNSEEITIAGLSLFLQAALHMADNDLDKVNNLLEHVIDLAQKMNEADDEVDETVH